MPTPRHITEIAKQVRVRSVNSAKSPGAWVSGVVASSVSDVSPNYRVDLDTGSSVDATGVIDAPLLAGTSVWLVNAGDGYLIVGLR